MRLSILGLLTIALLAFASCQKSDSKLDPTKMSDAELIDAIQNASNKQVVELKELPSAAKSTLDDDYAKDIIDATKLAPQLGYEVDLREGNGPRVAAYIQVYFDLNGRELTGGGGKDGEGDGDKGEWGDKERKDCFDLVLPVTFIMPDRTVITIEDKEDWLLIKNWYERHPNVKERPAFQYPVDVRFEDGTTVTVNSDEGMKRLYERCEGDQGWKERCFVFVYPVTFELPDGTTVTINNDEEMKAARMEWKENSIRPALQFPVDVKFKDRVITVNDGEEMRRIKEACDKERPGKRRCFVLVYPVTFELPDGSTVSINNLEEMKAAKMEWRESGIRPGLQYPVDIKYKDGTVVTINSQEEMKAAREDCRDKE